MDKTIERKESAESIEEKDSQEAEQKQLTDMPCIHANSGLERVGVNAKLYKKLLPWFHRDYSDSAVRIQRALENGNAKARRIDACKK